MKKTKNIENNQAIKDWESIEELFLYMESKIRYVILRNFENIPKSIFIEGHNDVDILVDDFLDAVDVMGAACKFDKNRVQCIVRVNNKEINFDIRYIGDRYYDSKWEIDILNNRRKFGFFYIPSEEDYWYSLLYHALIQKKIISRDYNNKLKKYFLNEENYADILNEFLVEKKYSITVPKDYTVQFNYNKFGFVGALQIFRNWILRFYYWNINIKVDWLLKKIKENILN